MKVPDSSYLFITGVIRAMEVRRIRKDLADRVIRSGSFADAMEALRDSLYPGYIPKEGDSENFDLMLSWRQEQLFSFLDKNSPDQNIVRLLKAPFDFHNIRVLLKNKIFELNDTESLSPSGSVSTDLLIEIFLHEQYNSLPPLMRDAVLRAIEEYYAGRKPVLIDAVIDRFMYAYQLFLCEQIESSFITDYIRLSIDLMNFQITFRSGANPDTRSVLNDFLIYGGNIPLENFIGIISDTGAAASGIQLAERHMLGRLTNGISALKDNIFALEKECDNTLIDFLKQSEYLIWGPEPVMAFGCGVLMEIKTSGMILGALRSGLQEEVIRKRLPELE
jgi:V/A-type H+-transporting ATPase subunit C